MSEFYSLIIKQNVTFLGLVTISLNISALLSRVVIKISKYRRLIVIALDEGERVLIVSFLPESVSRVLIVMPCDFSVWAPF